MEGLSSTYRQLFDSHTDVSVEWNPSTVTSELIKSYEMVNYVVVNVPCWLQGA